MTMREKGKTHVCPWWLGFFLASPLRKLFQNPEKILGPHVREGMTLVDVGSGMGFFSLPMARMAGPGGRVICFDVQEKMLRHLARRAAGAGLSGIIETRLSTPDTPGIGDLAGSADFLLLFAVVHEVPDRGALFHEAHAALKKGGRALIAEPTGHESAEGFQSSLDVAREAGFEIIGAPPIGQSRTALLEKK